MRNTVFLIILLTSLVVFGFTIPSIYATAPTISLNPQFGLPGTVVTVTGSSFTPNSAIKIKYDNNTPATFSADGTNHFAVLITVPISTIGLHAISDY